jgi:DNA-binding LacI/PurR family transcriptional regulator
LERSHHDQRARQSVESDLDTSSVRSAVGSLAGQRVDGVIVIAPVESAARGLRDLRPGLPVVAVEAGYSGEIPVVSVDQLSGAKLATDHLLALGHRTVWHVAGPAEWLEARERIEGWPDSLSSAGVTAPPMLRGDWSPESGYRAGLELAGTPGVSAVFAANDQMALGVMHAFHERNVKVPDDISVVGFDNIPEAAFLTPALTTVHQDFDEVGRRGLWLLMGIMTAMSNPPLRPAGLRPLSFHAEVLQRPGRQHATHLRLGVGVPDKTGVRAQRCVLRASSTTPAWS